MSDLDIEREYDVEPIEIHKYCVLVTYEVDGYAFVEATSEEQLELLIKQGAVEFKIDKDNQDIIYSSVEFDYDVHKIELIE